MAEAIKDVKCRFVDLNGNAYEVGAFIGEVQIVSILACGHDDRNGVDIVVVTEDDADNQKIHHRGPYTLSFT